MQCVRILEQHPEWGGESRRISIRSLEEQKDDISKKLDHINPRSWKGDVRVCNVIPRSCWDKGRRMAEKTLSEASITCPFAAMDDGDGFDILCPFGGQQVVLVEGIIHLGEEEETGRERRGDSPTNRKCHQFCAVRTGSR